MKTHELSELWWLSFSDDEFLGAAIVEGVNFMTAVMKTHALGINPGGQVLGQPLPKAANHLIADQWKDRLLTKSDCEVFDAEMQRLMTH